MSVEDKQDRKTLTWLHVSDFHFKDDDSYDRDVILRSLISAIEKARLKDSCPDCIFVTGDVAHSGREQEYAKASDFFDKLRKVTVLDKNRLFIVPGNHDVDRHKGTGLVRSLSSEEESVDFFDPEHPQHHFAKLEAFRRWFNSYFEGVREFPSRSTCQTQEIDVRGIRIGVVAINSALFSLDQNDHGKLWIGRRCLDKAIAEIDELSPHLRIALIHHPLEWLHEDERSNIQTKLSNNVDCILRGHLHEAESSVTLTSTTSVLHLAAGAAYQSRKYPNRAFFVHVDLDASEARILPIRYEDRPQEVWTTDTSVFPESPNHEWRARLKLKKGTEGKAEKNFEGRQAISLEDKNEGLLRTQWLDDLASESRARCIMRWQAIGLSRAEANALLNNPSVGLLRPEWQPTEERPFVLLLGEMGIGKSLIAERLLQAEIEKARGEEGGRLPVYLDARRAAGRLQDAIKESLEGFGDPKLQDVIVIVDGADEVGTGLAGQLLNETRIIVEKWLRTRVVITSRPIPTLKEAEESTIISVLSDTEVETLISRIAGVSFSSHLVKPESLKDAIRRPLFAILFGVSLKNRKETNPHSKGELLSNLVTRSLQQVKADFSKAEHLLQRLAILSTDRSTNPVPIGEVGTPTEIQPLLESRLVIENGGALSFPLPILTQWFAAQSLATDSFSIDSFINDPGRVERWKYAFIIFVSIFGHDKVSKVLSPLAETNPAITAEIVDEGLVGWGRGEGFFPPSFLECGQRIRTAMQSWVKGVGPLAPFISPVREDGSLPPLGVQIHGEHATTSWYSGNSETSEVVRLPVPWDGWETDDWMGFRCARAGHQPAWAWRWTFEELVDELSDLLKRRGIPLEDGPLAREVLWEEALTITGQSSLHYDPISLDELERRISQFSENTTLQGPPSRRGVSIDRFRSKLEYLRQTGKTEIENPWPIPDRSGGRWVSDRYSTNQKIARTKAVFEGALEAYQRIVETLFPNFSLRLHTAVLLPVRVIVSLGETSDGRPTVSWYFEVLPRGSQNSVEIHSSERSRDFRLLLRSLKEKIDQLRPEASEFLSASIHHEFSSIFLRITPAMELVYRWLWNDLKRVGWVKGSL